MPQYLGVNASISGDRELAAALASLPDKLAMQVLKPAVDEADKILSAAQEGTVPHDTGTLAASIGAFGVKLYPQRGVVWGAAGVRKGFARSVAPATTLSGKVRLTKNGRVVLKKLSKAQTGPPGSVSRRDPRRYAWLAEHGRKEVRATKAKALFAADRGTCFGVRAKETEGSHFAERAFDSSSVTALDAMGDRVAAGIDALFQQSISAGVSSP